MKFFCLSIQLICSFSFDRNANSAECPLVRVEQLLLRLDLESVRCVVHPWIAHFRVSLSDDHARVTGDLLAFTRVQRLGLRARPVHTVVRVRPVKHQPNALAI